MKELVFLAGICQVFGNSNTALQCCVLYKNGLIIIIFVLFCFALSSSPH